MLEVEPLRLQMRDNDYSWKNAFREEKKTQNK